MEKTEEKDVVVLAAGGTGGHIFPAEALAEQALQAGLTPVLITDRRFQGYGGAFANLEVRTVRAGRGGGGVARNIKACGELILGILQARSHLKDLRPVAVVGFGGYPSFPTLVAAFLLRIPVVIHEQNAVLGRVNRWFAPYAARIATAYPKIGYAPAKAALRLTGNPVRAGILALRETAYRAPAAAEDFRLLILGGSQGASVFSEILPAALMLLPEGSRARLRVEQQCRAADLERVRAAYEALGIPAELATFFADIPARLSRSHLVISRAGAGAVAELTVAGRPAILVPLPSAMDDHQTANARALAASGGAWLMPQAQFTAETLAQRLALLLEDKALLTEAAARARDAGMPDAAAALLKEVMGVGSRKSEVGFLISDF